MITAGDYLWVHGRFVVERNEKAAKLERLGSEARVPVVEMIIPVRNLPYSDTKNCITRLLPKGGS